MGVGVVEGVGGGEAEPKGYEMAQGVAAMSGGAASGGGEAPFVEGRNRAQSWNAVGRD